MEQIVMKQNRQRFMQIAGSIQREGIDKVIAWLDKNDFFTAPASTQYHLSEDGGLCQHSLNVYDRLCALYGVTDTDAPDKLYTEQEVTLESIKIVALFHDICKVNCYVKDLKNVKVNGKWEQQEYWKWDEKFIYGHGSKSVYILQQFMQLYVEEAQAIRFHMSGRETYVNGQYEPGYEKVYEESFLALSLHLADMYAAYRTDFGKN